MSAPFGDLGPCDILFSNTSLGATHATNFQHSADTAPHHTAQYGTSPKDEYYVGSSCTVVTRMTESTIAQLDAVLSNGTVLGSELMIASNVGTSLRDSAGQLVLKPYSGGTASVDAATWITVFVAAPRVEWDIVFDAATDREYQVSFTGFPATSVPSGETYTVNDLFAIGYGETS